MFVHRLLRVAVVALLLAALAGGPAVGAELSAKGIYDSGPIACNTPSRMEWIQNPLGITIRIRAVETWMGMSERGVADFWSHVYLYSPSPFRYIPLQVLGWDHYAEPTAPANMRKSFGDDWITLGAKDHIYVYAGCSGYPNIKAHVIFFIEYTLP